MAKETIRINFRWQMGEGGGGDDVCRLFADDDEVTGKERPISDGKKADEGRIFGSSGDVDFRKKIIVARRNVITRVSSRASSFGAVEAVEVEGAILTPEVVEALAGVVVEVEVAGWTNDVIPRDRVVVAASAGDNEGDNEGDCSYRCFASKKREE